MLRFGGGAGSTCAPSMDRRCACPTRQRRSPSSARCFPPTVIPPPWRGSPRSTTGASRSWGSSSPDQVGDGIDFGIEQRFEAGSDLAVEDGAADLEQEIGAPAGPPHLLGFVHAAIDQEVGGPFRDRRADP